MKTGMEEDWGWYGKGGLGLYRREKVALGRVIKSGFDMERVVGFVQKRMVGFVQESEGRV